MSAGLIEVLAQFETEEACIAYLEAARWPDGVRCPACGGGNISKFTTRERRRAVRDAQGSVTDTRRIPSRHLYQCGKDGCRYQFSSTAGTAFERSHLPLQTWFRALALELNANPRLSARQLERELGVSYATAWFLHHRIREALKNLR